MAPPSKETLDQLMRADAGYSKDLVLSALLSTLGDPDAALSYLRKHENISTGQDDPGSATSLITIVTRITEGLALTDLSGRQVENGDGHDDAPDAPAAAPAAELVITKDIAAEAAGDVGILSEAEKESSSTEKEGACVLVCLDRCCSSFSSAVSSCFNSFLEALPMICCVAVCIGLLAFALSENDCESEGECGEDEGAVEGNATSATRALLRGR